MLSEKKHLAIEIVKFEIFKEQPLTNRISISINKSLEFQCTFERKVYFLSLLQKKSILHILKGNLGDVYLAI